MKRAKPEMVSHLRRQCRLQQGCHLNVEGELGMDVESTLWIAQCGISWTWAPVEIQRPPRPNQRTNTEKWTWEAWKKLLSQSWFIPSLMVIITLSLSNWLSIQHLATCLVRISITAPTIGQEIPQRSPARSIDEPGSIGSSSETDERLLLPWWLL